MSAPINIAASHRTRIGCSQIAQALGLSGFGSRYDLWRQLTGRKDPPDLSNELRVALGEPMEHVLRPFVAARLGRELRRDRKEYLHFELPLVGHVDYRAGKLHGESARPVVDMKTSLGFGAKHRFGTDDSDEVDESVFLQMHGYLLLTGADTAYVAALVPGPELKVFTIHSDAEMSDLIENGIRDFWRCVETDTPPDPVSEAEARQRWAAHRPGSIVEQDDAAEADLRDLARVKGEIRALERQEGEIRNRIIPVFGDAEAILYGGRQVATYRSNKPSTNINWQAVAADLAPPPELVVAHTHTVPGARVLRLNLKEA